PQHNFLSGLADEETRVILVVLRLKLIGRKRRVDGLRRLKDVLEKLRAAVFLADAAEVGTEVTAPIPDTVALETLRAAFGEKHLLTPRRFSFEREDLVWFDARAQSLGAPLLRDKPLEEVAHENVGVCCP